MANNSQGGKKRGVGGKGPVQKPRKALWGEVSVAFTDEGGEGGGKQTARTLEGLLEKALARNRLTRSLQ